MLELFIQGNYEACNFLPFYDYINGLENVFLSKITHHVDSGCLNINIELNQEEIKIIGTKERDYEWITVYKINSKGETYEQIEFMIYTNQNERDKEYNRIIKYSAHLDDSSFSHLVWSSYFYLDNQYLNGKRELRKISIEDLPKIFYSKTMNLTELVSLADSKIFEFYEVKTLIGDEVKELKLEY